MSGVISDKEIIRGLQRQCLMHGSLRAFARSVGISAGHISRVISGEKIVTERIARAAGYAVYKEVEWRFR